MTDLEKAKEWVEKKEFEQAIVLLDDFLTQQPNHADALYIRAISYRKIEKYDQSVADLSAVIKRLPDEATLFCDRGISHFKNKSIKMALKDMDKAVELEPNNPYRYSSRAYIKAKTDIEGAMADYAKAIELDPEDEIFYNNCGILQENAGRMKAAKKIFKKSDEIRTDTPQEGIKNAPQSKKNNSTENTTTQLLKIMWRVFTSKTVRKEYFQFLKSKL